MNKSRLMNLAIAAMLMPSTAAAFNGDDENVAPEDWGGGTLIGPFEGESTENNLKLIEGWTQENSSAREAASAIRCIESLAIGSLDIEGDAKPIGEKEAIGKVEGIVALVSEVTKPTAAAELETAAAELETAAAELETLVRAPGWEGDRVKQGAIQEVIRRANQNLQDLADSAGWDEGQTAENPTNASAQKLSKALGGFHGAITAAQLLLVEKRKLAAKKLLKAGLEGYLEKTYEEQNCDDANVLCLNTEGRPIKGDSLSTTLAAGKKIKVVVITEVENNDSFSLSFLEVERVDVLIEANSDEPRKIGTEESGETNECKLIPEEEVGYKVAVAENFTIPKSIGVVEVSIDFKRIPKAKGERPVTASYGAYIEHGKYYIDLGLFVPFAIAGKRKVVARQIGQERYLAVETDLSVTAGLAMNVFPGGRRRGEFTPWSNLRCPAEAKGIALRNCRRRARARPWAELLGLQIGADLDVRDPIDQFYFGLVLEPVTGVTLSSGVAVMKIDHLKAGLSEGQLVASDDDMVARQLYGVRPFLSFGLSLDLVQAIRAARERLAAQKP